jgi:membrane protease YdiL (CAAX protease family)
MAMRTLYPLQKDEPRTLTPGVTANKPKLGNGFRAPRQFTSSLIKRVKLIRPNIGLAVIVAMAVIGSQATLIWVPRVGLFVDVACFVLLTTLALMRSAARPFLISLAVLPVTNIVSSSVITHNFLARTTIFYVTLLLLAELYRYTFSLDAPVTSTRLTWRGYAFALPLMVVTGQAIGLIGYAFLRNRYEFSGVSLSIMIPLSILFALCEEIFIRGLVQQQAAKLFHPGVVVLLTSLLYVFMSTSRATMLTLGPSIFLGLALAITYSKKQNLLLTTAMNAASKLTYIGLVATFIHK